MDQKKICMLGAPAVGKTSLVRRFVHGIFSERHHTTAGVKIEKKLVEHGGQRLLLMLWDLHGEDEFRKLKLAYLRGACGHLIVADGTRPETLERAYALQDAIGDDTPFLLLLNKADLEGEWALSGEDLAEAERRGWTTLETSAKTGANVERAFLTLTQKIG